VLRPCSPSGGRAAAQPYRAGGRDGGVAVSWRLFDAPAHNGLLSRTMYSTKALAENRNSC